MGINYNVVVYGEISNGYIRTCVNSLKARKVLHITPPEIKLVDTKNGKIEKKRGLDGLEKVLLFYEDLISKDYSWQEGFILCPNTYFRSHKKSLLERLPEGTNVEYLEKTKQKKQKYVEPEIKAPQEIDESLENFLTELTAQNKK